MEKVNARGGEALKTPAAQVKTLQPAKFQEESVQGLVLDTRPVEAYAAGHIPGSYSVWSGGLGVFAGWIAGPGSNVYLVLDDPEPTVVEEAVMALARVGIDHVQGVLAEGFEGWRDAGLPIETLGTTTPAALRDAGGDIVVLDVRDDGEFEEEGHIRDAKHLYVGYVEAHAGRLASGLDKDTEIVVTCGVGHRASLAASMLRRAGYRRVTNLLGGMTAWEQLGLPTADGPSPDSVTTPQVEGVRS